VAMKGAVVWVVTPLTSACRLLLLVSCFAYSSKLKMEVIFYSETSGYLRTTRRYNPEDLILHSYVVVGQSVGLSVVHLCARTY
jgi:hypothetical protein